MSPISIVSPPIPAYGQTPDIVPSSPIGSVAQPEPLPAAKPGGDSFSNLLGKMVAEVNGKQSAAAEAVNNLQGGDNVSLHQAVIAMEEANVSFQLLVEVRNKMLEAYKEVMQMQI